MPRLTKLLIGLGGTLIVLLIAGFFIFRWIITKSYPTTEGTIALAGLQHPVEIRRNAFGVPTVTAQTEHDLFFAEGYLHAQDRLWQMDLIRRAGEGRLSEVLGSSALPYDRLFRTIGIARIARRIEEHLSPVSRRTLEAYSAGVNACIERHRGRFPIEFDILNYTPEPWKPEHSLIVARMMAWELNISWYVDLTLGALVDRLGEARAAEVFPGYPENAPVIVPKEIGRRSLAEGGAAMLEIDQSFRKFFGIEGTHIGSNAWAVAPFRSETGAALLANDPHLGLSLPAKWYEIHLAGGGFNVAGVSLPGAPFVIIGHNRAIAWGMTNLMADDADFYIEKTDSAHAGEYLFRNAWHPFEEIQDTIRVRDSASVPILIRSTLHGPVVNSLNVAAPTTDLNPVTLRWTGADVSDEIDAFYRINRAKNWEEFKAGVREFAVPGQNFVYADSAGHIGYVPGVRLPIRASQNPSLPLPGWTGTAEWTGYVPFEKLPELYDPPGGIIATANNRMADKSFPYYISNLWEPPSRIERIEGFLASCVRVSVNDCRTLQSDYVSPYALQVVPYILRAYDSTGVPDAATRTVLTYFRNWNAQMSKDNVPASIFEVFYARLLHNLYETKMGDTLFTKFIFVANVPYRVTMALLEKPNSWWYDDPGTPDIETRDVIIRRSLREALEDLRLNLGPEMKAWTWGRLHTLTLRHPFGSHAPLGAVVNEGPFPVGGSGTTVNNGEFHFAEPFAMVLGPSMRQIVDFSDIDHALVVIPGGESGQPLNKHYADQLPLWLEGGYLTLPLNEDAVAAATHRTLRLKPAYSEGGDNP